MNQQPDRVNFFVTNPVHDDDEGNHRSQEMFNSIMAGRWQLPQESWVFMLCTAFTVLMCQGGVTNNTFQLVRVRDEHVVGGETQWTTTSELTLVCWLHRISTPDTSHAQTSVVNLSTHVDPLAKLWGCDRLVWAQEGEHQEPAGYRALWNQLSTILKPVGGSSGGGLATAATKARQVNDAKLERVEVARKKLNQFLPQRLRAPDAFAGHAYCAVQTTSVSATPVAVMPAFATCSDSPQAVWISKCAAQGRTGRLAKFGRSQGHLLSKYTHLRLNLFVNPRGDGVC